MRAHLLIVTVFTVSCVVPVVAAESTPQPKSKREPAATEAAPASGQSALRVYVDPLTGRRTSNPAPEQRAAQATRDRENPAFNTSSEGLREESLPGGGVIVHLDGRFQSAVVVRRGADGKLQQVCNNPIHAHLDASHVDAPVVTGREER